MTACLTFSSFAKCRSIRSPARSRSTAPRSRRQSTRSTIARPPKPPPGLSPPRPSREGGPSEPSPATLAGGGFCLPGRAKVREIDRKWLRLRDDVRNQLIFKRGNLILEFQLAFLQARDLQLIGGWSEEQR